MIAGCDAGALGDLLGWYRSTGSVFMSPPSIDGKYQGEEWFLILEDDACVRETVLEGGSFVQTVRKLVHSLHDGVDILYLGHVIPKV